MTEKVESFLVTIAMTLVVRETLLNRFGVER
jgi:hypothetical protein